MVIAMIPARFDASRLPGKLMMDLDGKSVILRTYEAVLDTDLFDEVYVVTDSEAIEANILSAGGKVIRSIAEHSCGSDRIAEAIEFMNIDIVINIQGDEPFIDRESLSKLITVLSKDVDHKIDLASLKVRITDSEEIKNPNNIKVVTDRNDLAIYFSRSVIPYNRDNSAGIKYYKHIGVYAFRKRTLLDFYGTISTPLEISEKIEAIRYQEMGKKIKMVETRVNSIGIDTIEDLEKAREFINTNKIRMRLDNNNEHKNIYTMSQSLYSRLKPEVLKGLDKSSNNYKFSIDIIIAKLKSEEFYSRLSIDTVSSIETFSGVIAGSDGKNDGRWDFRFGDIWFYDWKALEYEMDNIEKDRINENN